MPPINWIFYRARLSISAIVSLWFAVLTLSTLCSASLLGQQSVSTEDLSTSRLAITSELVGTTKAHVESALQRNDFPGAEQILVKEIERKPRSPELLRLLGHLFFLDRKYLNCAVAMKKADALDGLDQRGRFLLAMSYVRLKRNDWARPELLRLQREFPKTALYPYWIGRLDYSNQRFQAAADNFQKARSLDPKFVKALDNLGLAFEALGRQDEALVAYEEANRLNRLDTLSPWPPHNMGSMLSRSGRFDEAETLLRESIQYDAAFARAHYQLGTLLEKRSQLTEAVEEFQRAATSDPSFAEPQYALMKAYRKQGDMERSRKALEAFQRIKARRQNSAEPDGTSQN